MKKVYQTKFGEKEGNCFSACLASILEVPIDTVPCYHGKKEWYFQYKKWLNKYNLDLLATDGWKEEAKLFIPNLYVIVSGTSPRGFKHAVVYLKSEMVHDPHPKGGGVKDILDWIYIIPKYPKLEKVR